jgi:hypothetical protein
MARAHMSAFATVVLSLLLLTFASLIIGLFLLPFKESFGAQGGEMVQLASSHVPTAEDVTEMEEERKQMQKEIINMTGYW